jgi:hypothetical protein
LPSQVADQNDKGYPDNKFGLSHMNIAVRDRFLRSTRRLATSETNSDSAR